MSLLAPFWLIVPFVFEVFLLFHLFFAITVHNFDDIRILNMLMVIASSEMLFLCIAVLDILNTNTRSQHMSCPDNG